VFEDPTPSTTLYLAVGETRKLNCSATGSPSPTTMLTKQTTTRRGVGSRDKRNLLQLNGKYTIANAAGSDFGTYVCTANNGIGTVTKQITVVRGGTAYTSVIVCIIWKMFSCLSSFSWYLYGFICTYLKYGYELNCQEKKVHFINSSQNEGVSTSCIALSYDGFGSFSWHSILCIHLWFFFGSFTILTILDFQLF
jgi:hypothetical protein